MPEDIGLGTKVWKIDGTASTAIANITSVNGPGFDTDDIDITDMDDTSGVRQFIPGLIDGGEVELELNYVAANHSTVNGLKGATNTYKIVYPDASNETFTGYLKSLGKEAPLDDKITQSAAFKVSGATTFATS